MIYCHQINPLLSILVYFSEKENKELYLFAFDFALIPLQVLSLFFFSSGDYFTNTCAMLYVNH